MTSAYLGSALAGLGLGLSLIVAIGAQNAFVLRQGIRREHVLAVVLICVVSDAVLIVAGVGGAGAIFTAVPALVDVARWGGALFLVGYGLLAARRALRWRAPGEVALIVDGADGSEGAPDEGDGSGGAATKVGGGLAAGSGAGSERGADHAPMRVAVAAAADATGSAAGVQPAAAGADQRLMAVVTTVLALTWLNPHVYLDTVVLLGSIGSSHGDTRWAFAAGAILGSVLWFSALGVGARALAPVFARPNAWRVLDGLIAVVMITLAVGLVLSG